MNVKEHMDRQAYKRNLPNIAAYTFVILAALLGAFFFQGEVSDRLWDQNIKTIMEMNRQGANTLAVQLRNSTVLMRDLANNLSRNTDEAFLEERLKETAEAGLNVRAYMPDGTVLPGDATDSLALASINMNGRNEGVISPHINTSTGVNVYDVYVKGTRADGSPIYFVRESRVNDVVGSFTLSFYNNRGFSYVVDASGNILMRPRHRSSNLTVRNIFDAIDVDSEVAQKIHSMLEQGSAGWAQVKFDGRETLIGYYPVNEGTDWQIISIIPKNVITQEADSIIHMVFLLLAAVIFMLICTALLLSYKDRRSLQQKRAQSRYTDYLLNTVSEGISVMESSRPHRTVNINSSGLAIFGYGDDEDERNRFIDDSNLTRLIVPEYQEKFFGLIDSVLDGDNRVSFEIQMYRLGLDDAPAIWVGGVIDRCLTAEGKTAVIVTYNDITKKKEAESAAAQARRRERRLLLCAVSTTFPICCISDLNTMSFDVVNREHTQISPDVAAAKNYAEAFEAVKKRLLPQYVGDFCDTFAPEVLRDKLLMRKSGSWMEMQYRMADGSVHWVSLQSIGVKDRDGSFDAIFMFRVIDEQKAAEESQRQILRDALVSAQAANKAKSAFLSNMSHDIRTPLNAIIGMTAIVGQHVDNPVQVKEGLKKIDLSGKHLLSLINDVLDMSKIESGKMTVNTEPFNVAELVSETLELVRSQVVAGKLVLTANVSAVRHEMVLGDKLRVRQILLNIIGNAIKYTPAGGSVYVELTEVAYHNDIGEYTFKCRDTGIGMSDEFMKQVFDPFTRADDTSSNKVLGTGLGLAITKNLINLLGGGITVESELGKGSTFTVMLPLKIEGATSGEQLPEKYRGQRCLVVDDDLQTCRSTVDALKEISIRAEYAMGGVAAITQVVGEKNSGDPFTLVILDWKMPDMDGVAVTRKIRAEVGPDVPIIILTAYDWTEIEEEALDAGVTTFLPKPFYRSRFCYVMRELEENKNAPAPVATRARSFEGKRILLVDDNEINSEIAAFMIRNSGAEVEFAINGEDALNRFRESAVGYFDLIFMDVQMPVMDGHEATRAIRALERDDAKKIPIIAMTANVFQEDVAAARQSGMNDHCGKPLDPKRVYMLMDKYIK